MRVNHTYGRGGALAYLAAYDVHRAKVFGRTEARTGIEPFMALVAQVMSQEPFADRGYDFDKYRRLIRARGVAPRIARRGIPHGSGLGKTCWVAERTFAWLHQFKRLRIRYEIRADLHLALLQLACSIICLRRLGTSF
jgi:IS5 family transposase